MWLPDASSVWICATLKDDYRGGGALTAVLPSGEVGGGDDYRGGGALTAVLPSGEVGGGGHC